MQWRWAKKDVCNWGSADGRYAEYVQNFGVNHAVLIICALPQHANTQCSALFHFTHDDSRIAGNHTHAACHVKYTSKTKQNKRIGQLFALATSQFLSVVMYQWTSGFKNDNCLGWWYSVAVLLGAITTKCGQTKGKARRGSGTATAAATSSRGQVTGRQVHGPS